MHDHPASPAGIMLEAQPTIVNATNLIERLRRTLLFSDLDCRCQDKLAAALDRFATLERRRLSRQGLTHARDHKDRIAAILTLLSELDQTTEGEQDRSVFEEMALLFLEIASSAQAGAAVWRAIEDRQ